MDRYKQVKFFIIFQRIILVVFLGLFTIPMIPFLTFKEKPVNLIDYNFSKEKEEFLPITNLNYYFKFDSDYCEGNVTIKFKQHGSGYDDTNIRINIENGVARGSTWCNEDAVIEDISYDVHTAPSKKIMWYAIVSAFVLVLYVPFMILQLTKRIKKYKQDDLIISVYNGYATKELFINYELKDKIKKKDQRKCLNAFYKDHNIFVSFTLNRIEIRVDSKKINGIYDNKDDISLY